MKTAGNIRSSDLHIDQSNKLANALGTIVHATSATGRDFFDSLVVSLTQTFGARYAFVATPFGEGDERTMRTIALCADGELQPPMEYSLRHTPCEKVYDQGLCYYPQRVADLFPKDTLLRDMGAEAYLGEQLVGSSGEHLGILVLIDDRPLDEDLSPTILLPIFSRRAGTELERLRMEEALSTREKQYRTLFEHALEGFVVLDPSTMTFIDANAKAQAMFGLTSEELATVGPIRLSPELQEGGEASAELGARYIEAALRGEHPHFRWLHCRKDGTPFVCEVELFKIPGQYLVCGSLVDLSQREEAERLRDESQQRLELALESAGVGAWDWKRESDELLWSGNIAAVLGEEPGRSYGDYLALVRPADKAKVEKAVQAALERPGTEFAVEHRIGADGDVRWIEIRGKAFTEVERGPLRMAGTVTDVTGRRELQDQLLHSQRMEAMGRVAGGIAHDFNNILTTMLTSTYLLQRHITEPRGQEVLTSLAEAVERGRRLTRQLLTFTRKEMTNPVDLDLNHAITAIRTVLTHLTKQGLDIVTELEPELPALKIDSGHCDQLIMNLCINASDATEGRGRVTIRTRGGVTPPPPFGARRRTDSDWILLEVEDNGSGMTEEVAGQIWEPFFTTKAAGEGTGLGLAICKSIIDGAGGVPEVQSRLGEGTTFSIYFPAVVSPGIRPSAAGASVESAPAGSETILLVEDDPLVKLAAVQILEQCGYSVISAQDGDEGARLLEEHADSIDLLFSDMIMPHRNGIELATAARELRPDLPVILTSGYDRGLLDSAAAEEEWNFLHKPYEPVALTRLVRSILDRQRGSGGTPGGEP